MQVVLCGRSLQVPVELCWGVSSAAASHAQSCSWRSWTLSGSSCWQLCLSLAKDVPPSSLAVLQMGSQDCSEEYNSWVRALKKKKKSVTQINALLVLFWKLCVTSSKAAAGGFTTEWGFSTEWGFPVFCQVPIPRVALLSCCQSVPAWCCSQGLHYHLTHGLCWESHFNVWKATKEILRFKKICIKLVLLTPQISMVCNHLHSNINIA